MSADDAEDDAEDITFPTLRCVPAASRLPFDEAFAAVTDVQTSADDESRFSDIDLPIPEASCYQRLYEVLARMFDDENNKAFDGNVALVNTAIPPFSQKVRSSIHPFTHSLIHPFIHSFVHSFVHHSFIHSLIHSIIHSFH
jgi:hypothetical protein